MALLWATVWVPRMTVALGGMLFLTWLEEVQEASRNHTHRFEASAHIVSPNIPLAKASHTAKSTSVGWGSALSLFEWEPLQNHVALQC